ncbi:MAG: 5'-3' exonuclease H3TH domain-containing protein, partial [Bradymonadaceae bacterium]
MSEQPPQSDTLYLVDGSSYIYRAHYGIRQALTNSEGVPTNAVYGFTRMLQTLLTEEEPEYIAVAFDAFEAERPNFRKEMFEEYKAHRDDMPEPLQKQLPYLERVVEAFDIPILRDPEVEADDLIASGARWGLERDLDVCIVSGDKDLMQLLGDGVRMYDTMRDEEYGPEEVEERFGVPPDKQKYVMAMAGDSSDNIPGVPGIGPKTGGKLIRQFDDLDGVYDNLDEVGGKKRPKKLARNEEEARLSLELVTLREDCELDVELEDLRFDRPDVEALVELFDELEFQSLREDLFDWLEEHGWSADRDQLELSLGPADHTDTGEGMPDKDYRAIYDLEELDEVVEACRRADRFAFDLETTSLDSLEAEIVGYAFAWEPHRAVYVPVGHQGEGSDRQLDADSVRQRLRPLLESEEAAKVLQHWKYEWIVLAEAGVELRGVEYDTMLMSYVLEPGRNSHGLDVLVRDYLDYDTIEYGDVAGRGSDEVTFDQVPVDEAVPYAAEDADVTLLLADELAERVR